ncbi:hypothetical protein IscW_ISCW017518, partial [Ixodes scapularis]
VCERCGTVGVKHAFYSKTKRYCSVVCSRGLVRGAGGGKVSRRTHLDVYNLSSMCHVLRFVNAKSASETLAGYMAKLRYEGFGLDDCKDFWVNLCVDQVYPVGWCASQQKPLIPPKTIEHKHGDWKQFLVKRLTGARTLPTNFHAKVTPTSIPTDAGQILPSELSETLKIRMKPGSYTVRESIRGQFPVGLKLEVVDKKRISSVRVAKVTQGVGGRIHIVYESLEDDGFWCHERSPLIHPIGWAQVIGHDLRASPGGSPESLHLIPWVVRILVSLPPRVSSDSGSFREGMKLEAIDPLNLSTICVATVTKVLRNNYLMIGIDGMMAANGSDWFCYHASSPCIFPVGFCELNGIDLTPPRGGLVDLREFRWFDYLRLTKSQAAPVSLF